MNSIQWIRLKIKLDKWDLMKLKRFCKAKDKLCPILSIGQKDNLQNVLQKTQQAAERGRCRYLYSTIGQTQPTLVVELGKC